MWLHTVTQGGEVKGKLANGVGSQYPSHYLGTWCIRHYTTADAHTSAASSQLNWRSHRFRWTRTFHRKTKSGFCACAITFKLASTSQNIIPAFSVLWCQDQFWSQPALFTMALSVKVLGRINTLRTGLWICLNARSRGLAFRHRASCI